MYLCQCGGCWCTCGSMESVKCTCVSVEGVWCTCGSMEGVGRVLSVPVAGVHVSVCGGCLVYLWRVLVYLWQYGGC